MTGWNPTATRWLLAGALVVGYAALCFAIWWRERAKRQQAAAEAATLAAARQGVDALLVVYASQTGQAQEIALETARQLHAAGEPVRICPMHELTPDALQAARHVLWVLSTCGEGDPPDHAARFVGEVMARELDLSRLRYGLLSLGDRQYTHFCGFGRSMDAWLQRCGATRSFAPVEMDNGDPQALQQWQASLAQVAHVSDLSAWRAPEFENWTLSHRLHLNPGSAGSPVFHIELAPPEGAAGPLAWESGDLVQVRPPQEPDRPREYSIASVASDGRVHLLVRQLLRPDGTQGVASTWLTHGAPLGSEVALRLRPHSNFRLEENARRPLILIGNGTGLAGLRGHLRARQALQAGPNWLIWGERNAALDFHYQHELKAWLQQGHLQRLDAVFSRDQPHRVYVQHVLRDEADTVRAWVAQGAALYVCGSLQGMAQEVDQMLRLILGAQPMDELLRQGRYRRDVY